MTDAMSRRSVLLTGAGGAAAAIGMAACSSSSGADTSSSSAAAPKAAAPLAKLDAIPVGSAVPAKDASGQPVIVARPTSTTAVGFSAICTHRGCTVAPSGKTLNCPCHGSVYDAKTGKVLGGPAPAPLRPFAVKVVGGEVLPA